MASHLSPPPPARPGGYDVNATPMSYQQHERGIHALRFRAGAGSSTGRLGPLAALGVTWGVVTRKIDAEIAVPAQCELAEGPVWDVTAAGCSAGWTS